MQFERKIEKWKISKLLKLLGERKFVKLPHQRPLTLKKGYKKLLIDSVLKNKMEVPFYFANLQTSLECSSKMDKDFFRSYIEKGYELSIEDCQHRMTALESITDEDFVDEFLGKKDDFLNGEIITIIYEYCDKDGLISRFGKINSGKTVTNDNLIWGENNEFNNFIKNHFVNDDRLLRLYKTKKKSESVERILYGNVLKIIKVCVSNDGLVSSANTNSESMMSFIKANIDVKKLNNIIELFEPWYDFIKQYPTRETFATQSALFFIIHILNKKKIELKYENINGVLLKITDNNSKIIDTRSSAEKRYNDILTIIENEK